MEAVLENSVNENVLTELPKIEIHKKVYILYKRYRSFSVSMLVDMFTEAEILATGRLREKFTEDVLELFREYIQLGIFSSTKSWIGVFQDFPITIWPWMVHMFTEESTRRDEERLYASRQLWLPFGS